MSFLSVTPKYAGKLIVLLCGAYIVNSYLSLDEASVGRLLLPSLTAFLVSTALFVISNLLAANAWQIVTDPDKEHLKTYFSTCSIWMMSNVAKYLPGNVFHYVSRFRYCHLLGVNKTSTTIGLVSEVLTVGFAAFILCLPLLASGTFNESYPQQITTLLNVAKDRFSLFIILVALLTFVALFGLIRLIPASLLGIANNHARRLVRKWPGALLSCILSFFLAGMAAFTTLHLNSIDTNGLNLSSLIAAYSMAFIFGYLIPGAPGGLGVREAILIGLLSPFTGTLPAMALAATLRLTSVAADFLCALVFSLFPAAGSESELASG